VGIDKVIAMARKMGVTSPLDNVVSFPLGVNPIKPIEMAGAFAAIANDGLYNAPYFIDKITDASGNLIYEHEAKPVRVMSSQSARQEIVALQAVVTGGTATRAQLSDRPVAGKTGTTDKHGDAWFIGFTPQLATAVWMGNPESVVPMNSVGGINVFGGTFPALLWHNFMAEATILVPIETFTVPEPSRGGKFIQVSKDKEVKRETTTSVASAPSSGPATYPPTVYTFPPTTGNTVPPPTRRPNGH
jgi:penicillin-binding protein 1A